MAQFAFDAASHVAPPRPELGPLPAGMYPVIAVESALKDNSAGTGQFLAFTLQVIDGEFSGRKLWDNLNVNHPNKTAEDIARRQLQELCLAAGVSNLTNTEQLHDRPVLANVEIDRKDKTRNRITGYASVSAAQGFSPAARQAPASTPASKPARPWEKR